MLDLTNGVITAGIPVAGAHYLAQSHNGNRILVLGSRADTVTHDRAQRSRYQHRSPYRYSKSVCSTIRFGQFSATTTRPLTS